MDIDPDQVVALMLQYTTGPQMEMVIRFGHALELPDAFWDLVGVVEEGGNRNDALSPAEIADTSVAGQRLDPETRARIRERALQWEEAAQIAMDALPTVDLPESTTLAEVAADPFGFVSQLLDLPTLAAQLLPGAVGVNLGSLDEIAYAREFSDARARSRRTPLLLSALFVAAFGTIEPFVTRMVHLLLFHRSPDRYTSLSDPDLDREARRLCNGPPDKWRNALVDQLGVTKLADAVDWPRLGQMWEDRNVLVHRGGLVDARHSMRSGVEVGTVMHFRAEEVRAAIDEIGAARSAIVVMVWDHMYPGSGAMFSNATGTIGWAYTRANRWRLAEGLGRVGEVPATDPQSEADAKVNRWLALERGHGPAAIRDQVSAWDVTDLDPAYALAKLILLHEDEPALELLRTLVSSGTIDAEALKTWLIFDRLRDEGRLNEFLAS